MISVLPAAIARKIAIANDYLPLITKVIRKLHKLLTDCRILPKNKVDEFFIRIGFVNPVIVVGGK